MRTARATAEWTPAQGRGDEGVGEFTAGKVCVGWYRTLPLGIVHDLSIEGIVNLVERLLPAHILERASLRGNEYAWALNDIPNVIEAGRQAGLVNIGGQLQFRLPDGSTCECYWVEVDTYQLVSKSLLWPERVERAAEAALEAFTRLPLELDFLAEGRKGFAKYLDPLVDQGLDPADTMCFAWYVTDQAEEERRS